MYRDNRQEHEKDEFTIYDFYGIFLLVVGIISLAGVFVIPFLNEGQIFSLIFSLIFLSLGFGLLLARKATPKKVQTVD